MPALVSSARGIDPIRYCRDSFSSCSVNPSRRMRVSSSSMDAMARSTLAGLTPARMTSGPASQVGVERAGDVVRHPLPLADAVAQPAADRVLAEHVVHQPEGVVVGIRPRDGREPVGDVGLRLVHHRHDDPASRCRRHDRRERSTGGRGRRPPSRRRRAPATSTAFDTADIADDDRRQLARPRTAAPCRASKLVARQALDDSESCPSTGRPYGMAVAGRAAPSTPRRRAPPGCPRPGGSP